MRKALATLPGVEKDSIQVDVSTKEAKFKVTKFDEGAAKKAISDLGYSVTAVKTDASK